MLCRPADFLSVRNCYSAFLPELEPDLEALLLLVLPSLETLPDLLEFEELFVLEVLFAFDALFLLFIVFTPSFH